MPSSSAPRALAQMHPPRVAERSPPPRTCGPRPGSQSSCSWRVGACLHHREHQTQPFPMPGWPARLSLDPVLPALGLEPRPAGDECLPMLCRRTPQPGLPTRFSPSLSPRLRHAGRLCPLSPGSPTQPRFAVYVPVFPGYAPSQARFLYPCAPCPKKAARLARTSLPSSCPSCPGTQAPNAWCECVCLPSLPREENQSFPKQTARLVNPSLL